MTFLAEQGSEYLSDVPMLPGKRGGRLCVCRSEKLAQKIVESSSAVKDRWKIRGIAERHVLLLVLFCVTAGLSGWTAYRTWPRELPAVQRTPATPVVELRDGRTSIQVLGLCLAANLATFDDELLAYLFFDHLRGLVSQDGRQIWLTFERQGSELNYVIRLSLPPDLDSAVAFLFGLEALSGLSQSTYYWVAPEVAAQFASQSRTFDQAYNLPANRHLELLPREELVAYVRRFIRFKSATDGRIRRGIEPIPTPPSRSQAHQLARDIVTIADFYDLPIDFFLGIGAMENNYMNVRGDIGNAIWKRRAQKGDVVLKRGRKGVLVLNESSGVWQITRETLRYADRLRRKDERDYSKLPEHLRPPKEVNLDDFPPELLTTYAGLLLRDLLDRFHGDVASAVGAYNGGPGNPNRQYEAGARTVAQQARRVLEHAAALRGRPAAEMRFITSAR
ncbi:MAG: hypothetical protein HY821_24240 [Acidobacteria bacterium]|nr:hypothetical protein [Acidobacteriota bacterium]